ncbi:hypothetical protein LG047_12795 [Methylocystis sp. WRRC1]|uniref:hypothetical protein n=1 Tax=unclassified Methylocystis TaxID=2625913 RepID=UPI0001F8683A|nr:MULTISPECIES: hypothetical protein [unclassified Methylocystis]MCC3246188.1 hypothetical protein [Methylocystis sp. WRRC1]
MRRFLVAMAVFAPLGASALTTEQGNFAKNLAILLYAEKRCPELRMNMLVIVQAMREFGLPKDALEPGGEIAQTARAEMDRIDATFGSQDKATLCSWMEDGFGPRGSIASGFLKRR